MKLRLIALIAVFTLVWSKFLFAFAQDQDKNADMPASRPTRNDQKKEAKKDEAKSKDGKDDNEKDKDEKKG